MWEFNQSMRAHVFLSFFAYVSLEMSLFPSIFCTIAIFLCTEQYVVRFPLPDGVFSTYYSDHGLDGDFCTSASVRIQLFN